MVPLMVLAWDVRRLFYARGEIQKAADAAALAAAREVDALHYMLGEVLLHQGAVVHASLSFCGAQHHLPAEDRHLAKDHPHRRQQYGQDGLRSDDDGRVTAVSRVPRRPAHFCVGRGTGTNIRALNRSEIVVLFSRIPAHLAW